MPQRGARAPPIAYRAPQWRRAVWNCGHVAFVLGMVLLALLRFVEFSCLCVCVFVSLLIVLHGLRVQVRFTHFDFAHQTDDRRELRRLPTLVCSREDLHTQDRLPLAILVRSAALMHRCGACCGQGKTKGQSMHAFNTRKRQQANKSRRRPSTQPRRSPPASNGPAFFQRRNAPLRRTGSLRDF